VIINPYDIDAFATALATAINTRRRYIISTVDKAAPASNTVGEVREAGTGVIGTSARATGA
jgi:hypothetical protein